MSLVAYLQLMRPPNILTALADILVGYAAASSIGFSEDTLNSSWLLDPTALTCLLLSTAGLYGGGVVFNDVFDAELDACERPERPLPRGAVSRREAAIFGTLLFIGGVSAAAWVSSLSMSLALLIVLLCLSYNALAKHHPLWGPLNMGLCRGVNLLLGVSVVAGAVLQLWFLAVLPLLFIAAITVVSRGEVHGGSRNVLTGACGLYVAVIAGVFLLGALEHYRPLHALPFAVLFAYQIFRPLLRAMRSLHPDHIKAAVKAGVLSLIILDAAVASGFAGWQYGIPVLLLLPLSLLLAKKFSVT